MHVKLYNYFVNVMQMIVLQKNTSKSSSECVTNVTGYILRDQNTNYTGRRKLPL